MRPIRWRRSTHVLVGVAVLVLVAVVVAVAALAGGGSTGDAVAVAPRPALATATPDVVAIGDTAPEPTSDRMAVTLAPLATDPNLGVLGGRITDAVTGTQLWAVGPRRPLQPASINKVLTSAAALLALDRDARLTTTVIAGDQSESPGVVVLRGGGDPTLSAAGPKTPTWYRDAARISDLADQVRKSGVPVKSVRVDLHAYSGPTLAPGWDPADIGNGDIAPIESVMLDAGRTQPVSVDSRRSNTPALDAGRALAAALGVNPATVTVARQPASGGRAIASVQSPPLMSRLRDMMNASDNVMAESIGREVAAALGRPRSFDGAAKAVLGEIGAAGIDTGGAVLLDSSGLSIDDRLTAQTLDEVLNAAAGSDEPRLRPLVDLLPIAGGSGTLSNRYLDTEQGLDAAGFLRAKTGSLTGTNTLAGIVTDASGRVLTFAFLSNDAGPTGRTAIDALAAALHSCGCGR